MGEGEGDVVFVVRLSGIGGLWYGFWWHYFLGWRLSIGCLRWGFTCLFWWHRNISRLRFGLLFCFLGGHRALSVLDEVSIELVSEELYGFCGMCCHVRLVCLVGWKCGVMRRGKEGAEEDELYREYQERSGKPKPDVMSRTALSDLAHDLIQELRFQMVKSLAY